MVSASVVYGMGADRFMERAADAGLDGVIIPDLDLAEPGTGQDLGELAARHGLAFTLLIAPTTPAGRAGLNTSSTVFPVRGRRS